MSLAKYILTMMAVLVFQVCIAAQAQQTPTPQAQQPTPEANQTVESVSVHISSYQQKSLDIEKKIAGKIREIKEIIEDYNTSERSVKGPTGLGRIEQLELKAERYSIERQARKRIEREINELIDHITTWESYKVQIKEAKKLLELKQKILSLESNVIGDDKVKGAVTKQSIEYYEVKKDATLKDISALPDVYGNATSWKLLYDANRDKIKDPTKVVPVGTVLVVPNIKNGSDFEDLQ
jgi:nucleoid-associated protein YgaU